MFIYLNTPIVDDLVRVKYSKSEMVDDVSELQHTLCREALRLFGIRRAIEVRDQHCTYPGCRAKPAWCQVHHLIRFGPDGPTSEDNGGLLCGRHHRHVHAHGMVGEIIDGHVVWRSARADGSEDSPDGQHNAHLQHLERALRNLARRWLARNPHLQPHPPDTS